MITIETLSIVFTGLSISLAAFYYINTLRHAQRSQKHAEDTRKIQLLMQIHGSQNVDWSVRRQEVINLDFEDIADFQEKLDWETFAKVGITWAEWNQLGLLLKNGFIDHDMMFEFLQYRGPIVHWEKYGDIIREYRRRYGYYSLGLGFEYLAEEMAKYRERQGQLYPQHEIQSQLVGRTKPTQE